MRLEVFNVIDSALEELEKNHHLYREIEEELYDCFSTLFYDANEMIVGINSRIKSKESLREKIIRNRMYTSEHTPEEILGKLSDLIGIMIECRFIEDEYHVYKLLKDKLCHQHEDGFYYQDEFPQFRFECNSLQPQLQKNGFSIYRIDGYYQKGDVKVSIELQIKALVSAFWGDIEHKLVYKNTNFYVYDGFMKEILASIKANLTIIDRQLKIVYDQMQDSSTASNARLNEGSFEMLISKAINDLFATKMNQSIGFTMNLKNISTILGHYIFIKDIRYETNNNHRISSLFKTFKKLNSITIDFEKEITMEDEFYSNDEFIKILGSYLLEVLNKDYDWYVFLKMLFTIEPGNNLEDFSLFLNVIKNYLIDDYWIHTSFVKLTMEDSQKLQAECVKILAKSLVEIGTIEMIHDDKMVLINKRFIKFVEELEARVISYSDYLNYQSAYYEEWMKQMRQIFM